MYPNNRTVLIDMDDTLCCLTEVWLSKLNERFRTTIKIGDLTSWNTGRNKVFSLAGITSKQVFEILEEPGIFRGLKPVPGALTALKTIVSNGWDPYIVTSLPLVEHSPGSTVQEKMEWISEHLTGIVPARNIVFTYQKWLVNGQVLIDDAPHNIASFPRHIIVYDQPWNRQISQSSPFPAMRATYWSEIPSILESLTIVKKD